MALATGHWALACGVLGIYFMVLMSRAPPRESEGCWVEYTGVRKRVCTRKKKERDTSVFTSNLHSTVAAKD